MSDTPTEERMDSRDVLPWAEVFRRHLLPACQRVTIAGSLRRGEATVGDIEFVVLPIFDCVPTLFDKGRPEPIAGAYTALDKRIEDWIRKGYIVPDADTKRMGPKYKRYTSMAFGPRLAIELFVADEKNVGNQELLRTGNQAFSQAMLSARASGGLLPRYLLHYGGYLWFEPPGGHKEILPCTSEEAYFRHAKIEYVDPPDRNERRLEQIRSQIMKH